MKLLTWCKGEQVCWGECLLSTSPTRPPVACTPRCLAIPLRREAGSVFWRHSDSVYFLEVLELRLSFQRAIVTQYRFRIRYMSDYLPTCFALSIHTYLPMYSYLFMFLFIVMATYTHLPVCFYLHISVYFYTLIHLLIYIYLWLYMPVFPLLQHL